MKIAKLLLICLVTLSCKSQESNSKSFTYENFDTEILNYQPVKNENSQSSFTEGLRFLEETKKRIRKNNGLDVSDYWNLLTVFNNLNESNENIDIAFRKFFDTESSCEYLLSFEKLFDRYTEYLQSKMVDQLKICRTSSHSEKKETINTEQYSKDRGLDKNLVALMNSIGLSDQKDRYNKKFQKELDIKNQLKIDSLFSEYKTYIGRTLVGNEFENVMWQVIQHSRLDYMEKYLPIVYSAVKSNELKEGTLKYLIDRIYSEKYNYQIFGSQDNVRMIGEQTRNEVKAKYKIE